ncbi:MAG: glyoxalase [Gammaproteobacteria bacterium]|nr:glyoxalase [Gammaproteobacteria bacterium]
MKLERTGIILSTENYQACVDFYSTEIGLPILEILDNAHSKLTTLGFGPDTCLMIETEGEAHPPGKSIAQNPVVLRFKVRGVEAIARTLEDRGAQVNFRKEVWGTVGDFVDPDGNRCSLREEVAVGMPVTRHPPHRSVRALLTHTAPTSSQTRKRWFGYG